MKIELLELLRCPETGQRLTLERAFDSVQEDILSGWLLCLDGHHRYPIHNSIPRFVSETNYADNFGMQWNLFRNTQLDSYSHYPISADRFWKSTDWSPGDLKNQWVLDVGCGAGRFAEIALNEGAKVVALDYSSAVDACYANLKQHRNLHVVQGDIYALPFKKSSFPFVYSLGVLQHTPDVASAFAALPSMVCEGGKLCVDYYSKSWKSALLPKYWLRPITKHLPKSFLLKLVTMLVPKLLPVSRLLGQLPFGHILKRVIPVADPIFFYERENGKTTLSYTYHTECSVLDTYDWLSPEYDNPQTTATVRMWMEDAGMGNIEVLKAGHLVVRGDK